MTLHVNDFQYTKVSDISRGPNYANLANCEADGRVVLGGSSITSDMGLAALGGNFGFFTGFVLVGFAVTEARDRAGAPVSYSPFCASSVFWPLAFFSVLYLSRVLRILESSFPPTN